MGQKNKVLSDFVKSENFLNIFFQNSPDWHLFFEMRIFLGIFTFIEVEIKKSIKNKEKR